MSAAEPFAFTSEDYAAGKALFEQRWSFVKGVVDLGELPPAGPVEIAFAGRSNVGKSSLLNALVRQGGLARTSNTPGRTQELNYFVPECGAPYLIDMPGYGFAEAPRDKVEAWTLLVKSYLGGRQRLARVFLLVDARHGIKAIDRSIMKLLDESAVSYQAILTKADKISRTALAAVKATTEATLAEHTAAYPLVIATSSETGEGIEDLRAQAALVARQHA